MEGVGRMPPGGWRAVSTWEVTPDFRARQIFQAQSKRLREGGVCGQRDSSSGPCPVVPGSHCLPRLLFGWSVRECGSFRSGRMRVLLSTEVTC